MIELGKRQILQIVKKVEFGVYLADADIISGTEREIEEKVLLPRKEVPEGAQIGDEMEVFIYRDSKDRLIATTRHPYVELGKVAVLKVQEIGKYGAFLDWGLEKDLLLPFREQTGRVQAGQNCLAALYIDKSKRLCATMKVYHYLEKGSSYQKDDKVQGIVYEISDNFGAFVAVDNRYSALISKKEPIGTLCVGDKVEARVTEVLEDGKLSLSLREKAYLQMNTDAEKLLQMLKRQGGTLPLGDKSSPDMIREQTGMSKNEFKRAIGNLYKQRLITIEEQRIKLV